MDKFILIEREKNAFDYCYAESFNNYEDAYERMKALYHDNVVMGDSDTIESAVINDYVSSVEFTDGNALMWNIMRF